MYGNVVYWFLIRCFSEECIFFYSFFSWMCFGFFGFDGKGWGVLLKELSVDKVYDDVEEEVFE